MGNRFVTVSRHKLLMLNRLFLTSGKLLGALILSFTISTGFGQEASDTTAAEASAEPAAEAAASGGGNAELISLGKSVFEGNCTQCHAFDKVVVGPNLTGAHTRWPSKEDMLHFIQYPQKVIDGGDEYSKGLYEQYKQYMPNHDFLSDEELNGLYAYIVEMTENPPVKEEAQLADGGAGGTAAGGAALPQEYLIAIIGILVVILLAIIIALALLLSVMKRFVNQMEGVSEEEKAYVEPKLQWSKLFTSAPFLNTVGIIFTLIILRSVIDGLFSVGVQQGYAPTQPIAFSHKLHAGMYEIGCQYCHTGVEKSKNANIPSANICMNCHNHVKTTSPEIQKIWKAVENDQPIEWVRIHNLPDLAYFNHSQHVKVGGLECQTCHGPIEEMEVVQQYSPLTMGWCINCHRETAVNYEGNEYYDKLIEFHEANQDDGIMTVEDIGGLECSKCHY
ncbi:MAG: cytochrome c3 family protein [Cytophagales bacterium]